MSLFDIDDETEMLRDENTKLKKIIEWYKARDIAFKARTRETNSRIREAKKLVMEQRARDEIKPTEAEAEVQAILQPFRVRLVEAEEEAKKARETRKANVEEYKRTEHKRAIPNPLDKLGFTKPVKRKQKKMPPPVPGTEHKYQISADLYQMTPAYMAFLKKNGWTFSEQGGWKSVPDMEELD